jgi:serine/threonine protein phosphatase PrpC
VYGVIDGVGGHAAGEVAAGIARDVILQRLARPLGTPAERVRESIAIANNEIFRRAGESPDLHGMACVVTLAIVADGALTIGHVGDTRLYKVRANGLRKLTRDHSPVGEREDARELSEAEAMRHPRRNEVFRDVGSGYRDKDELDFVELIEEPFERDCAILLCTDGLTDMVTAGAIERTVRQHAGKPQEIVNALVAAANEAGGKDNVTVVYAEAPGFAPALRGINGNSPGRNGGPAGSTHEDPRAAEREVENLPRTGKPRGGISRIARAIIGSRITWFAIGALAGVLGALALVWRAGTPPVEGPRTLIVGGGGAGAFPRIADAIAAARTGDVVQLEPGQYLEQVVLLDGVDLVARVPGTVTVGRPDDARGEVIGVTATGSLRGRVSGIRVESTSERPMDVGVRVAGQGRTLELLDVTGPMHTGIDVAAEGAVTIQGSLLAVHGAAVTVGDRSQARLVNNVILRAGQVDSPFPLAAWAQMKLERNVFGGFGADVIKGLPAGRRQEILAGNIIVASPPSFVR